MPKTPIAENADMSQLARALAEGTFALTAEITPPVSPDPAAILAKAEPLRGLVDGINVTDGARAKAHVSSLATAAILVQNGFEPVLQMTCRDRNRIALEADLLGAWTMGIRNIMLLRGDNPPDDITPAPKPVFDMDSVELAKLSRFHQASKSTASGNVLDPAPDFLVGGADMPIDPDDEWRPGALTAKADAGMGFVQTQFCFDSELLRRYVARLSDFGITERLGLIIGIGPLASAKSARWMRENLFGTRIPDDLIARLEGASDQRAEGITICAELIDELATIKGVAGAHLMSPTGGSGIAAAIKQTKVRST